MTILDSLGHVKIGVDIDNTILPETKTFISYVKDHIDSDFTYANWNTWDLLDCVHKSKRDVVFNYLKSFFQWSNVQTAEPMEYALEFLKQFSPQSLYYITARSHEIFIEPKHETLQWFAMHHVPHVPTNVFLQEHYKGNAKRATKGEIAYDQQLDAFFEDNPVNAEKIAKVGCPVFLIDYPYNRTLRIKNVYRIGEFDTATGDWIINPWEQAMEMLQNGVFEKIILEARAKRT